MAKKQMEEDLLAGGSLASEKDKSAKNAEKAQAKAEKAKAKAQKTREKNDAKKAEIKEQIDELKEKKNAETDEVKKQELDKKIKKLADKYSSIGVQGNGLAPRTNKIIKSTIAIVLVVALLCCYVATGAVRKGFVSAIGIPAQYFTGMTVTNGENKIKLKVSTYNYYFAQNYNQMQSQKQSYEQYGLDLKEYHLDVDFDKPLSRQTTTDEDDKEITYLEYLNKQVLDSIEQTYTYYLEAVKANDGKDPEITDEQQTSIDDALKQYRETAHGYGYTLSAYLVKAMGKGVTEHVFRQEATRAYIAQNYQNDMTDTSAETEVTDADIEKYADEHKSDLVSVDIRFYEATNEDDAKAFVKELNSDASNFTELAAKYADDAKYKDPGYSTLNSITKAMLKNKGLAIATADEKDDTKFSGLDWLFSKDRKAGDVKQYSTSVVYVLKTSRLTDQKTVNVRHILIAPEVGKDEDVSSATDKQWAAAYKKAQKVLDEYKKGAKTEDSFAALVADNSTDTGSTSNGGLYENVVPGQMVDSFSYFCFGQTHKKGDTAIVRSDYGYHIMYFVGHGDKTIWQYTASQNLASTNTSTKQEQLEEDYKLKVNWLGSRYFEKDTDIDN